MCLRYDRWQRVRHTLRFINPSLDTLFDRFDTKGIMCNQYDDDHFIVSAEVELSDQFFEWICCFGNSGRITSSDFVIEQFTSYLDKICGLNRKV